MLSPALGTIWCLLSLQTQSHEWPSHFAVMATKSELFHSKEMVRGRWQLNYITYAHMVPHLSLLWARNSRCGSEQHFLEDTPCTCHSPSPLHWEPEPQPNVRPQMSHFHLWYWSTGHKHYLWWWRYLPSRAEMACCFHFTARLSFRSRCYSSCCWERLIFLTWIDNVGCGAHFLANQRKGSKQCLFVLISSLVKSGLF